MGIVLSVYTKNAFCDFLLPAANNEEVFITLKKDIFSLKRDINLRFENVDNVWRMYETEEYAFQDKADCGYLILCNSVIYLEDENGNEISCIVSETENLFSVFKKYDVSKETEITIGSDKDNTICYQYLSVVSRQHAVLKRAERGLAIQDTSSNGTFVNTRRINGNKALRYGDCINIFGLKIVYLGDFIAISAVEEAEFFVSGRLENLTSSAEKIRNEKVIKKSAKKLFHRSPRNYVQTKDEPIEIESAPTKKQVSKRPLWMVIGPSFTMMIPMLMGSILAIISAKSSGGNASVFMYTGIITAGSSALIGAYWALSNIRYNKKESLKEEQLRIASYSEYLSERESLIKSKYEKYISNLNSIYPEAKIVAEYGSENAELWNRNRKHSDFLSPRLGLGELDFPVQINVPKERFSMVVDELAESAKEIKEKYKVMKSVPITIDLLKHRFLGVVGGEEKKGAFEVIRNISAQVATANCYTDVKIIYVYDGKTESDEWKYARWLPHVWSEDKKTRFVAENKSEASDVFFEVLQTLRMRAEANEEKRKEIPKPYYILVISNIEFLEGELITKYIYDCSEEYGLTTLILVENEDDLPNECESVLVNNGEFSGFYNLNKEEMQVISFDNISCEEMERLSRRILSIQVKEAEAGRDIPNSLTFFEMYGINSINELTVEENWRRNRTYENMKALVGAKAGGLPCYLDAHEKYHGPHGLVAGTTGSGKSETLQTYILSLAINFSPDDIGYFIIDYKGGGMAGLFEGLPHLIGAISNLSGNQVRRAMVSIKSENRRRQRIFSENNVNSINQYTKLYKSGEAKIPIPHMFIIVDEFAELKREEPEFMKELISVAQVGRSLGVHLILATQKPSGTVDDNIWSNSKFRLCLRVQDRQDSNDMLHKPDAAYITQAGRSYLQVGNDEIYELFQSGYSGAVYDESEDGLKTEVARMISVNGKASLIGNSLKRKQQERIKINWVMQLLKIIKESIDEMKKSGNTFSMDDNLIALFYANIKKSKIEYEYSENNIRKVKNIIRIINQLSNIEEIEVNDEFARKLLIFAERNSIKLPETKGKTQLNAVIEYLAKVAKKEGYGEQMKLWLPPLAGEIYLDDLFEKRSDDGFWKQHSGKWNLSVPVGMCDDPENQAQFPLVINFTDGGHLAICGTIASGKSTFIQTLLFGLIKLYSPDWVNLYIIDFSSNMLNAFSAAPHVGGIMTENDIANIDKFFFMMESIIEHRKKLFLGGNYANYVQANGVVIPAIIIALDGIGAFKEKTEGKYDDKLLRLLKEGISFGIYFVISAAGFSSAEISMKMSDNIKTAICLQMNDKFAYSDVLRKSRVDVMPESNVRGRGLALVGEKVLEYQTALALPAEDDFQRMSGIEAAMKKMSEISGVTKAKQIPTIPELPVWSEFEQLSEVIEMSAGKTQLPIGYCMRSAEIYGIDLRKNFIYLISGKNGSGKTNLQKAIIREAAKKNGRITVIEHMSTELKLSAKNAGAGYISNIAEQAEFFESLIEPFKQRNMKKRSLLEEGKDGNEIFREMQKEEPYFIFIDDIVSFIQSMENHENGIKDIRPFVENIAKKGKLHNVYFFIGINPGTIGKVSGTRMLEAFLESRKGIHLGGSAEGVSYFDFNHLSFSERGKAQKTGIAILPGASYEKTSHVVIPLVRG